jgi:HK97 family phage prohead protease
MDLDERFAHERVEQRSVAFTDIDVKNDGWSFSGYATVFDVVADMGDYTEDVKRGSIRKALPMSGNVPMVYDHNMTLPILATTEAGTLGLKEDGKGMAVRTDLPKHFMGEAVRELVQRGDIRGMSFGFIAGPGNSRLERRDGRPHRSLIGFKKILDVSPTWDPAYQGTSAELRSLRAAVADAARDDLETLLRAPDIQELRAALKENLEGLQSTVQRIEAALANVPTPAVPAVEDDTTDETTPVDSADIPAPGVDATDEVEPAATGDGDEQRSGADVDYDAAARSRRLHMLGLSLPK